MSVRNGRPVKSLCSCVAFVAAAAALPLFLAGCAGSNLTAARLLASSGAGSGPKKPIIIDEAMAPDRPQPSRRNRRTVAAGGTTPPATTGSVPDTNPSSVRKVLADARTLRLAGRRDEALRLLNTSVSSHPGNVPLLQQRALLTLEVGDVDRAEKLLRKVAAKSPDDWRLHSALGAALAAKGNHKAAVAAFDRALQLAPGQTAVLNNLAMSHAMAGNLDKAEKLLRRIVAKATTAPQRTRAKQNLALVLGWRGKHDEARRIAAATMPVAAADANAAYLRRLSSNVKVSRAPRGTTPQGVGKLAGLPGSKPEPR